MKGLLKEFQEFILKGNMMDMAVGIVIGAAFTTVIKSLVDNVVMPPIGILLSGVDFSDIKLKIKDAVSENGEVVNEAVYMQFGQFINDIISLLIVGLCIFAFVKFYNQAKKKFEKKEEAKEEAPAEPSAEEKLLTEIRDLLAKDKA